MFSLPEKIIYLTYSTTQLRQAKFQLLKITYAKLFSVKFFYLSVVQYLHCCCSEKCDNLHIASDFCLQNFALVNEIITHLGGRVV